MKIGDRFETEAKNNDNTFVISITEESDFSPDGGYTFLDTTNTMELEVKDAKTLLSELHKFCSQYT